MAGHPVAGHVGDGPGDDSLKRAPWVVDRQRDRNGQGPAQARPSPVGHDPQRRGRLELNYREPRVPRPARIQLRAQSFSSRRLQLFCHGMGGSGSASVLDLPDDDGLGDRFAGRAVAEARIA